MVAEKMSGFGLNIITYDPYIDPEIPGRLNVKLVSFEELLAESDYISIHCPLTKDTRYLFGEKQFKAMKPGALLINTARGPIVNEAELVKALEDGQIAAAALDVVENEPIDSNSPLLKMDNVIVTPHIAWYSEDAITVLQCSVAEEVVRVLKGGLPKNLVNKAVLEKEN